jgi:hypothetical protein
MGLSDWMSGRGSEFAFEFAVIAATVSALASFFFEDRRPCARKDSLPYCSERLPNIPVHLGHPGGLSAQAIAGWLCRYAEAEAALPVTRSDRVVCP